MGIARSAALAVAIGALGAAAQTLAIGNWRVQVEWPSGTREVTLAVVREGDRLTATWHGVQGELEAREGVRANHLEHRGEFLLARSKVPGGERVGRCE